MPTLEHLVVPIEWKSWTEAEQLPDEWKAEANANDGNTLIGYASTFGNVDLGGDVVMPGAFTKSTTAINAKGGGIPLLADHVAETASVLGTINGAFEDDHGLVIKARISQAPSAQDTAVKLREGHLSKLSIGYETMNDSYEDRDGVKVRLLEDVKLWETSVVVFPMNPEATVSRMKTLFEGLGAGPERKALLADLEAKDIADGLLEGNNTDPPAKGPDEPKAAQTPSADDESAAAPDEGASGHYDKWESRALLAGRPVEEVDPVRRARLSQLLTLNESALADVVPDEKE